MSDLPLPTSTCRGGFGSGFVGFGAGMCPMFDPSEVGRVLAFLSSLVRD